MLRLIKRTAIVAGVFLGLFATPSWAMDTLDVKIPFPFVVHGRTLPSGEYSIQPVSIGSAVLLIRGQKGTKEGVMVLTTPASGHDPAGDKPSLTFKRYENQYRLATIWDSPASGVAVIGK